MKLRSIPHDRAFRTQEGHSGDPAANPIRLAAKEP